MNMKEIMEDWQRNAKAMEDENFDYLTRLKMHPNPSEIDEIAQELHQEAFEKIDCLACANCCKVVVPALTDEDVKNAADFLNMSPDAFKEKYTKIDEDNELVFNALPCPMLSADNRCTIYEARPATCRSFPHTHKTPFISRRFVHTSNTTICLITYYVLENMKDEVY